MNEENFKKEILEYFTNRFSQDTFRHIELSKIKEAKDKFIITGIYVFVGSNNKYSGYHLFRFTFYKNKYNYKISNLSCSEPTGFRYSTSSIINLCKKNNILFIIPKREIELYQ